MSLAGCTLDTVLMSNFIVWGLLLSIDTLLMYGRHWSVKDWLFFVRILLYVRILRRLRPSWSLVHDGNEYGTLVSDLSYLLLVNYFLNRSVYVLNFLDRNRIPARNLLLDLYNSRNLYVFLLDSWYYNLDELRLPNNVRNGLLDLLYNLLNDWHLYFDNSVDWYFDIVYDMSDFANRWDVAILLILWQFSMWTESIGIDWAFWILFLWRWLLWRHLIRLEAKFFWLRLNTLEGRLTICIVLRMNLAWLNWKYCAFWMQRTCRGLLTLLQCRSMGFINPIIYRKFFLLGRYMCLWCGGKLKTGSMFRLFRHRARWWVSKLLPLWKVLFEHNLLQTHHSRRWRHLHVRRRLTGKLNLPRSDKWRATLILIFWYWWAWRSTPWYELLRVFAVLTRFGVAKDFILRRCFCCSLF